MAYRIPIKQFNQKEKDFFSRGEHKFKYLFPQYMEKPECLDNKGLKCSECPYYLKCKQEIETNE